MRRCRLQSKICRELLSAAPGDLTDIMRTLSPELKDALTEVFNIGVGEAAASLSVMVGEEILLSVPEVDLRTRADLIAELSADIPGRTTAIAEGFSGLLTGEAMLLFPERRGLELVRALLREDTPLDEITPLERDALVEVGNVLLNACLGALGNLLRVDMEIRVPELVVDTVKAILEGTASHVMDDILFLRVRMTLASSSISGHVAIALDVQSSRHLEDLLNALINSVSHLP